jgi:outer membrane protein OmpA-like peptidoglycan-associated protein
MYPKAYQNRQSKKTHNIKNKQKDTQRYHNQILSKPCDNKKNPIGPITKIHTKNKPNKQKRNHKKTYFYNKTTQLKPEYNHILELFKLYLKSTQITTTNQHLTQFCINNNMCLESTYFMPY